MEIVNPLANSYAEKYTSSEDDLVKEIAEVTFASHPKAHMLSGHIQGKLLEMVSFMIRPIRILEIGTFTGFSALCLAKGLKKEGQLHTIEKRKDDAITAKCYFDRSYFKEQIILHIGDALDIIGELDETWDLIFIDADKESYPEYYELTLPKMATGGLIVLDNAFRSGEVLNPETRQAIAIDSLNKKIVQDDRVEGVFLTVRDGIHLVRKK